MDKLVLPESVMPGRGYSFGADLRFNAWAFAALGAAVGSRAVLAAHPDWGPGLRALVALSPLLPSLLYVLRLRRWLCGLDELQRRMQLEACLIATVGALFVVLARDLLASAGALPTARLAHGLGWEGLFATLILFVIAANLIVNRRYR